MEHFNEERLRSIYRIEGHDGTKLPNWLVDRIIIRTKLLTYNEKFVKEWKELKEIHENTCKSLDVNEWDDFRLKCKNFYERWHIRFPDGTHNINTLQSRNVIESWDNCRFGVLKVDIDLNAAKDRIIQEFDSLLTHWKNEYEKALQMEKNEFPKAQMRDDTGVSVKGNALKNIEEYNEYLRAYSLKNKGISIREIALELGQDWNDNDKDRSRKRVERKIKKAHDLISKGFPGLPPFPED